MHVQPAKDIPVWAGSRHFLLIVDVQRSKRNAYTCVALAASSSYINIALVLNQACK
ncbi:hypothetical protein BaRGS_00040157, partial [Batillaria attramentaria]